MNIEEYAELLIRKEWKDKRESILKRDNYTCQKCGRRGFSFRSFKISGYTELYDLMEEWTIKDIPVAEYLKNFDRNLLLSRLFFQSIVCLLRFCLVPF